jgi:hypothetical protein
MLDPLGLDDGMDMHPIIYPPTYGLTCKCRLFIVREAPRSSGNPHANHENRAGPP